MPKSWRSERTESFRFFCSASNKLFGLTSVASILPCSMTMIRLFDSACGKFDRSSRAADADSFASQFLNRCDRWMRGKLPRGRAERADDRKRQTSDRRNHGRRTGRAEDFDVTASQRAYGSRTRSDDDQIDIEPVLLEQPGVLRDPQRYSAAGNRRVRSVERFQLLRSRRTAKEKNREDCRDRETITFHPAQSSGKQYRSASPDFPSGSALPPALFPEVPRSCNTSS